MGYADGYYYGQGRIRVDTSTFSVGDTVRVRSMTDSSIYQDKAVVTVGTPLIFTVPPYDYYKVCTVQEINNVVTEVGGVYLDIGFGDFKNTNAVNKASLGGIKGILNAHQENDIMAIGDEVTIKVNNVDVVMQVAEIDLYDSHEITFVGKDCWDISAFNTSGNYTYYYSSPAQLRTKMQDFYNAMTAEDKALLTLVTKYCLADNVSNQWSWGTFSDYVFPPNCYEIFATTNISCPLPLHQFPIFVTQANRIKSYNGQNIHWWSCDGQPGDGSGNPGSAIISTNTGSQSYAGKATGIGVLPCFRLTADS